MNAITPNPEKNEPERNPKRTTALTPVLPPVLAVRLGRGRLGGSTVCDHMIQRGRRAGRAVMVADGDRRNPTLAGLYPPGQPGGASVPPSDDMADMKDWITEQVGQMVMNRASMVLDLGGGDRVLSDYGQDLPLSDFCAASGVDCLPLYFSGPEKDDFDHIIAIQNAKYFSAAKGILFLNENLVRSGKTPAGAFDDILKRPELDEMFSNGVKLVFIPRLPCMTELRASELSFYEAAGNKPGKSGKPMDPVRQFMVKTWIDRLESQFVESGITDWLP